LGKDELMAGIDWLGIKSSGPQWVKQVDGMLRLLDPEKHGGIKMDRWCAALELSDLDRASAPAALQHLANADNHDHPTAKQDVFQDAFKVSSMKALGVGRFKLFIDSHDKWRKVWATTGTLAEIQLCIWEPIRVDGGGAYSDVCKGLVLGQKAANNLDELRSGDIVYVTDTEESGIFASRRYDELEHFIEAVFPRPIRFRSRWSLEASQRFGRAKPLYVWTPIPPSDDFVCLSDVFTLENKEPSVQCIRCLPKSLSMEVPRSNVVASWSDAGMTGERACLWTVQDDHDRIPSEFMVNVGRDANVQPSMRRLPNQEFFVNMPASKR